MNQEYCNIYCSIMKNVLFILNDFKIKLQKPDVCLLFICMDIDRPQTGHFLVNTFSIVDYAYTCRLHNRNNTFVKFDEDRIHPPFIFLHTKYTVGHAILRKIRVIKCYIFYTSILYLDFLYSKGYQTYFVTYNY